MRYNDGSNFYQIKELKIQKFKKIKEFGWSSHKSVIASKPKSGLGNEMVNFY